MKEPQSMLLAYRLGTVLLFVLLLCASIASAQKLRTSHDRHLSTPPTASSLPNTPSPMDTTRHKRSDYMLGDFMMTFDDKTEAERKASYDCARGDLGPKKMGKYNARFVDRTVEAGTKRTMTDPNNRLMPGTLYVLTDPGSTSCVVWRVTQ